MVTLFLISLVIQTSTESDIAFLLGDGPQIYFYPNDPPCTSEIHVEVGPHPGSFANNFNGRVGSIYIENIGIFICGGRINGDHDGGCNWLRAVVLEGIHTIHEWQNIRYVENQNPNNMFGCAVVEREVDNSPGFWITGGTEFMPNPTESTYDWAYLEDNILLNPAIKEPYGRINHCLVKVKTQYDPQNFQYLEIGGDVPGQEYQTIETYHCTNSSCLERRWTHQRVDSSPDWTRPSCTVYQPARSTEEIVLVVSGGHTWTVSCGAWSQENHTCHWNVLEQDAIPTQSKFFVNTDEARLVTLNNLPTLFGASSDGGEATQVFQLGPDDVWRKLVPMSQELSYLVAVSVSEDYMCTGKHSSALLQTSTTTTTTTSTTTTVTTTTGPSTTTAPSTTKITTITTTSEACETNGICTRTDGRDITWEAEFGSEAVEGCPESEGEFLKSLL